MALAAGIVGGYALIVASIHDSWHVADALACGVGFHWFDWYRGFLSPLFRNGTDFGLLGHGVIEASEWAAIVILLLYWVRTRKIAVVLTPEEERELRALE